ncbi:MAG: ester cyclase [Aggregatilineales bacterium]
MSLEANKTTLRQYLEAWGNGDTDTLKALLDKDAETHVNALHTEPGMTFEPFACETWITSFPDTELKIEKLVAEGDLVTAYWVVNATHQAEFMGIAPTNKQVTFGGLEINRIVDGKIVEIWRLSDTSTLMEQLNPTQTE